MILTILALSLSETFCLKMEKTGMFKKLFSITISLIFKPSEAWDELSKQQTDSHDSFLSGFVYPFLGLIVLCTFGSFLLTGKEINLQIALKETIVVMLSVFVGFFLASYLVNIVWHRILHREQNMKLCQRFVGYSSSLLYSVYILSSLLPNFFFLWFFLLYTIYMVWEGAIPYMKVNESEQLKFVSLTTAIIIATPFTIEYILHWLMPGLNSL